MSKKLEKEIVDIIAKASFSEEKDVLLDSVKVIEVKPDTLDVVPPDTTSN